MKSIQTNIQVDIFEQLFQQILPEKISDNVFTMNGKEFFAIAAGDKEKYNSMIASGGGWGMLFKKPTCWSILRADRYTLEFIEHTHTYTISYFPKEYKHQMLFLGSKSGRESEKMDETELTIIQTPSGNVCFREARLVLECRVIQITLPEPEDFCMEEAQEWISETYQQPSDHRKYIFGEITNVWIKKQTV